MGEATFAADLLPFLDIVRAAAQQGFRWSATEVGTAFQWANRVQDLPTAAAAAVSAALEDIVLPHWLAGCSSVIVKHPRAVLLTALLQRTEPNPGPWFQMVVAGYIAACILPLQAAERPGAEADLARVLTHLCQQRLLGVASAALLTEATEAAAAAARQQPLLGRDLAAPVLGNSRAEPRCPDLHSAALQYFTSDPALGLAAAAQLMVQGLEAGTLSLQDFLGEQPTLLHMEVLCLAVLLPQWEATLSRLQRAGNFASSISGGIREKGLCTAAQLKVREVLIKQLCTICEEQPESVVQLEPPLVAEICRVSFCFLHRFARLDEKGIPASALVRHWQQLLACDDVVSDYIRRKHSLMAAVR